MYTSIYVYFVKPSLNELSSDLSLLPMIKVLNRVPIWRASCFKEEHGGCMLLPSEQECVELVAMRGKPST